MKRILLFTFICVFLCPIIMSFSVAASQVPDIDIKPIPIQSINLAVSSGDYKCTGSDITNVTYTAYTTRIPDGSKIQFYIGNPENIYPDKLLGTGEVKDGIATLRVYLKPGDFYIGSAVWTKPTDIIPPSRIYSNIVTFKTLQSSKLIDLKAKVDNSCKTNVTYTAKLYDLLSGNNEIILGKEILAVKEPFKVRFITYQIPKEYIFMEESELVTEDFAKKISSLDPIDIDYGIINNWTAKVSLYLKSGKYIVFADCTELTPNNKTQVFSVPLINSTTVD